MILLLFSPCPGIIAAIVISVPVLVAVGVLTVVAIPLVICLRRRRDQHRANNGKSRDTRGRELGYNLHCCYLQAQHQTLMLKEDSPMVC